MSSRARSEAVVEAVLASWTSSACRPGIRRSNGRSIRSRPARVGLTVADIASQISAGWLGRRRPICGCSIARCPCACGYPDAVRRDTAALGETRVRGSAGQLVPLPASPRRSSATAQSTAMRENLRSMLLVTARLEGRDLGSAVTELRARLAKSAHCRWATRSRLAARCSRSDRRSASCCSCSASPRRSCWSCSWSEFRAIHAGAADSVRRAAVARRRVRCCCC